MAKIKLVWTQIAVIQRNKTFEYWNKRNGSTTYSQNLNYKIKERLAQLLDNPAMGKLSVIENYRAISLGHFSIIYKITESAIYIMSFWDNRQDPKILPKNLKK